MGGQDSGRTIITTDDWMRRVEKRAQHEERRPLVRNAADLLGPGVGPNASEIQDWNDEATLFNGFFFTEPGALHTPDPSRYWMGYTLMNTNGYGYQRVYEYRGGADPTAVKTYVRTVSTVPGQGPQYGSWLNQTIPLPYTPPVDLSAPVQFDGTGNVTGTTSTAFVGLAGGATGNFIAPPSGAVMIYIGGYLRSSTAQQYAFLTWQWILVPSGETAPISGNSANDSFATQDIGFTKAFYGAIQTGLTPGNTYGLRTAIATGVATNTASIANSRIIVHRV